MAIIRRWRVLTLAAVAALVIAGSGLASYYYVVAMGSQRLVTGDDSRRFRLQHGESLARVAAWLADEGLIRYAWRLRVYGRITGTAHRLQAGEYLIEPGMTVATLMGAMVRGDVVSYRITVIEGWRFERMLEAIHAHEAVDATLDDASTEEVMASIGAEGEHPEGRFLPQTYKFPRGTTDKALLRRAYTAMQQILTEAWEQRQEGLPLDSPYQALTLASIIEKETAVPEERRRIAGVFVRRLNRGMRLQTDPTVIYGMGTGYDGNISRRDLRRDTPYNTYTRHGLPPTPIALPGEASVRAAVDPAEGEALYFVAKGDDKSHYFSETLQEHNRAVQRYQRQ